MENIETTNEDTIVEPIDYFNNIKDNITKSQHEEIINVQKYILSEIEKAKAVGQHVLVNDLLFTYRITQKELKAFANGFNRYVGRGVIDQFLDKVEPKGSIKVVDLEQYPRVIPNENLQVILNAKELDLFDHYAVVFTDLENTVTQNKHTQEFIDRNKDPIVLGYFYNEDYDQHYDRYYVITDWVDEYCDLTFDKMVREVSKLGIETTEHTLGEVNLDDLQLYIDKQMSALYGRPMGQYKKTLDLAKSKKSKFSWLSKWF